MARSVIMKTVRIEDKMESITFTVTIEGFPLTREHKDIINKSIRSTVSGIIAGLDFRDSYETTFFH